MIFTKLKIPLFIAVGLVVLFIVVYFGGVLFLPAATQPASDANVGTADASFVGTRPPYFDLPNLAGDHVTLGDFPDTPVLVVFWSTWDAAAADQVKILDDYLASPSPILAKVIAIDSQEERSVVISFMRRGGYRVPTLVDALGSVSEAYHIKSLPTFYFINAEGLVVATYSGVLSAKAIGDRVEQILK